MLRHLLAASAAVAVLALLASAQGGTVSYAYDAAARLVSATYSNGSTVTYTNDAAADITGSGVRAISTVEFAALSAQGDETATPVMIPVDLSPAAGGAVTVDYAVTDGTAGLDAGRSGGDFFLAAGQLDFQVGETRKFIELNVLDDDEAESPETVVITLSSPTGADLGAATEFTYTIIDEDTDSDSLSDDWERLYFGDLDQDGAGDPDQDTLTNAQEAAGGTDPTGKSWELVIGITESHVQEVSFGVSYFTSKGLDPGLDVLSPPAPPDSRYAALITAGLPDLVTDLRGVHVNDMWTMRVTAATDSARATSVLTWSVEDVPENGLRLLEVDANGNPVVDGADLDMAQEGQIAVSGGDTVYFQIRFGDLEPPTVEIATPEESPTKETPIPVTITFSRPVREFDPADILVGNGTAENLQGDHELYTVDIIPAADGDITVDIAAEVAHDHLGIENAVAVRLTIVSDRTAPEAPVVAGISDDSADVDGITNDSTLIITGTAEINATVEVFVDSVSVGMTAADDGGNWSFDHTATQLLDGEYVITAAAEDAAHNESPLSAEFSVTVDTVAPEVLGVPDLAAESDSGNSDSDNTTNDSTPTLEGTAAPGVTVALTSDVDGALGTTTADEGGDWVLTTPALSESPHTVTAVATDVAGNTSEASAGLTIVVDTTAPAVPSIPDLDTVDDSGPASDDNVTNNPTPTFNGTADTDAVVTLESDLGGTLGTDTADGTWSIVAATMGEGIHAVSATAMDAAGNTSSSSSNLEVTIDTTAPSTPSIPDLSTGSDSGPSDTDNITNDNTPTIEGTADEDATVTLTSDVDGVLGTADSDGAWTLTTAAMGEGVHALTATAADVAGNMSDATAALTVTIDTIAPAAPAALDLSADSDSGTSSTDDITNDNTPTLDGTADDGVTVTVTSNIDGVLGTTGSDGTWTLTTSAMSDATHAVTAVATDTAGNEGPASSGLTVTIDTVAPAIPSTPDLDAASDSGSSTTDDITNVTAPVFSGTADDGSVVTLFSDIHEDVGSVISNGTWTILTSALDEGTHMMAAIATDPAGNESAESGELTVVIDTSAPSDPSTPDLNAASDTGPSDTDDITSDNTPTFDGTAEPGVTVTLMSDLDGELSEMTSDGSWSVTATQMIEGQHSVTATATDPAGNTSAESAPLTVEVDTVAPTIAVASAETDPTTANPILFILTLSEPVIGLDIEDLAVTNGLPAEIKEVPTELLFNVTLTPTDEGVITLTVLEGDITDAAGNATATSSGASVTYEADLNEPWTAILNITGAQVEELVFGMAADASDGDDGDFDVPAGEAAQDGGYVAFVNEGLADFGTDIRGQADMATWRLQLTAPDGRAEAMVSWDPAQLPVVGLSLVQTDDQWKPLPYGLNIDMNKATSPIVIASAGSTQYFTVLYRHAVFTLAIHDGWNLLSVPIQPFDTAVAAVLQDVPVGPAWAWNATEGHYEAVTTVEAMTGFWLFYLAEKQRTAKYVSISGQRVQTPIQSLKTGWNLLAPVAAPPYNPIPLPLVVTPGEALGTTLWDWTGADYSPANSLVPGFSYWGLASEDAEVHVGAMSSSAK